MKFRILIAIMLLAGCATAPQQEKLTDRQIAMIMRVFFNMMGLSFSLTPVLVYWLAGYMMVERGDQNRNAFDHEMNSGGVAGCAQSFIAGGVCRPSVTGAF